MQECQQLPPPPPECLQISTNFTNIAHFSMSGIQSAYRTQVIQQPVECLNVNFNDLSTAVFTQNSDLSKVHRVKYIILNRIGLICSAVAEACAFSVHATDSVPIVRTLPNSLVVPWSPFTSIPYSTCSLK